MMGPWRLTFCVWELTLACDAHCVHCGSNAGKARPKELDTVEGRKLISDLAGLGCKSVTLSGGEPLLRRDWPTLACAIREAGMRLEIITNGLAVAEQADAIARAGFWAVTVSIDGPRAVHDKLRGVPGGLDRVLRGAQALRERGLRLGAVTQVNRLNVDRLEETLELLTAQGFSGWQVQLTMPHGRAREGAYDPALCSQSLCLEPHELPELETRLVALQAKAPLFMQAADNIGYMSRHEPRLRTGRIAKQRCWMGCAAGIEIVGITSDGTVRGCLSLPAGAADEGNVRNRSIADIWNDPRSFAYNRSFTVDDLGPSCRKCPFGTICRGGCQSLCWATTGAFHHNAHCILAATGRNVSAGPGADSK